MLPMLLLRKDLNRYVACFAAALFSFYDIFQLSLFNSTAADFSATFYLSSTTLGLLSSSFVWANALSLIPIGFLIDKYSVRPLAIIFLSLSIIACFIIAHSHSWKIIMVMRFIQGLASATSLLTCMRMAIRWFGNRANTAIGLMVTFALMGGIFGNNVFINIVRDVGWRYSFILAGIIGIVILIFLICFLFEANTPSTSSFQFASQIKLSLQNPKNILLGCYLGLMSLPIFILAAEWGNIYLIKMHHMSNTQAGMTTGLLFTGLICGCPLVGYIADRLRNPLMIMKIGAILSFIVILPIACYLHLSSLAIMILFLLLGMIGSSQNVVFVIIAENNPLFLLSTITAVASLVENCIGALGQLLFGYLLHTSWQALSISAISVTIQHRYINAMLIFPCAFIFATMIAFVCSSKKQEAFNKSIN